MIGSYGLQVAGFRDLVTCNMKPETVFILLIDFSLQHSTFIIQYSTFDI